ncbi:GT2 family glycosyltransferase [Limimaricola soesokkakensis]|uniref:GT2 family glycosyltransferase n=1 Tax=Limimaricola soesokkakensis TaxID=1343159 RepID=A0A1X6YHJ2_9RHOB|nr:galactosyltransferase-related protein [Limimaricola soesokkakensis]PSK88694.1 GT2 family glycosyltransferase [Limimaricola soesokkakensis]SLN21585.1 Glycosyl transferase family 2 [Limimaricola soesokkakensis]
MTASVLTIARGRDAHLANLVRGLSRQTEMPTELVIVRMQEATYALPDAPFPVRQVALIRDSLPLAEARNLAAGEAQGNELLFLDVDCIPDPDFVADYRRHLAGFKGLVMGEVMYLPDGVNRDGWDYADFEAVAERHSDRQGPPPQGIRDCTDYRCFWSLNFAIRRADFERIGGFDTRFHGYGGEDTDFGRSLEEAGMKIGWAKGARAYHQYHPHHMPPVHHLESVVRNAELFRGKWGHRTMGHWLHAFELMGLIAQDETAIRILRAPSEGDLALTRHQSYRPYCNSAEVIREIERRRAVPSAAPVAAE